MHKLRKFTGWYTHGVPHGRELRQRINEFTMNQIDRYVFMADESNLPFVTERLQS